MSDWILAIEGTDAAPRAAMTFALISAFAHALFGALQKGRFDPWLVRGSIDLALVVMSLPIALFLVPWPQGGVWWILLGGVLIHFVYKLLMAMAYTRGSYTLVYPVVRGTGPLVTVIFAAIFFAETYAALQWIGVLALSGGILALAIDNIRGASGQGGPLREALFLALLGGLSVAIYTVYDAWGIRSTPDPFTFLAWFFLVTSLDFPIIAYVRWRRMAEPPPLRPLMLRGVLGALIAFVSFGGVMLATRIDKVGEAAVLRETSVLFAALLAWLLLNERVGPYRLLMMALIALGAVLVEMGGRG